MAALETWRVLQELDLNSNVPLAIERSDVEYRVRLGLRKAVSVGQVP